MKKGNNIPHRIFWTWDHSTNWCLHAYGAQNCGVANEYAKAPEMFEKDYMRVVDFCAEHKFDAVGIVALLREKHGGVESARRLCTYAREKGVKIYIISGLFGYGGVYYDGDHKYNLDRFLRENPECMARTENGEPHFAHYKGRHGYKVQAQGCPSSSKLHEFALESLDWLFREIPELGGIQMESGDNGVCYCPECTKRRGQGDGFLSIADMARVYPQATDVVLKRSPDAMVICETYSHFLDEACKYFESDNPSKELQMLYDMPESIFWQWKADEALRKGTWKIGDPMLPHMQKFNHVMRAHSGTQWWGGRATFAVEKIRQQCLLSYESGINCVSMFGENAPFHVNAEFNYLAMEYFADHPHATTENFIKDVMAPLLGGEQQAAFFYESASCHEQIEKIPAISTQAAKIAVEAKDYETMRRWQYLASYLNGYYWEAMMNGGKAEVMLNSDRVGDLEEADSDKN